ncbi:MAG TPA: sulfite exporter TauE/SafE family protein [Bacteroidales bacterium]|nr:sulfite exporter TauE/SafE family protein [Bacteroidales bacterium]
MTEVGFLILGVLAGILSGLFGIGGGIVMVPSLIVFFGMDILDANATSLAAMLLPVGILGVIAYYKAGLINIQDSLWIALGLFLGSFAGGEFAMIISEATLAHLYAIILIYIAFNYLDVLSWFRKKKEPKSSISAEFVQKPFWTYLLVGVGAGIFAGLFGKGGGIVIVPLLIAIFRYEPKKAAATSLAALQLPVGLPSVIIYAENGHLNLLYAAFIAVGILFGALLGSKLGVKLPSAVFKKVFGVFLIFVAGYMVYKYIH